MLGEQLAGSLLKDVEKRPANGPNESDAFSEALKETKERIAAAFTKRDPIPARRKA